MKFFITRILNDDASAGGGNAPEGTPAAPQPFLTAEEAAELGISDKETLRTLLSEKRELSASPEEKTKRENLERANQLKYFAENNLMQVDEVGRLESLKTKSDKDLVFDNFSTEYKQDNPQATEDEIKSAFDIRYDLENENPATKKWAERKISSEAKSLRDPLQNKFETAVKSYNEDRAMTAQYPAYKKWIDDLIKENTPDKIVVFKTKEGEDDIEVPVELTKEDKAEIAKLFGENGKTFNAFVKNKNTEEISKSLAKKINGFIRERKFDQIMAKSREVFEGIGVKKGSGVGAQQPFSVVKTSASPNDKVKTLTLEESNNKIAQARQRFR